MTQDDQANDKPQRELAQPTMSELEDILIDCVYWDLGDTPDLPKLKVKPEALKAIQAYTDRAVTLGRIEAINDCIQLMLGTKTNDFDKLFEKLKELKALTISVRDGGSPSDGGKT